MSIYNDLMRRLKPCRKCKKTVPMIFSEQLKTVDKTKWYVACGWRKCGRTTHKYPELADACKSWGLKKAP